MSHTNLTTKYKPQTNKISLPIAHFVSKCHFHRNEVYYQSRSFICPYHRFYMCIVLSNHYGKSFIIFFISLGKKIVTLCTLNGKVFVWLLCRDPPQSLINKWNHPHFVAALHKHHNFIFFGKKDVFAHFSKELMLSRFHQSKVCNVGRSLMWKSISP